MYAVDSAAGKNGRIIRIFAQPLIAAATSVVESSRLTHLPTLSDASDVK